MRVLAGHQQFRWDGKSYSRYLPVNELLKFRDFKDFKEFREKSCSWFPSSGGNTLIFLHRMLVWQKGRISDMNSVICETNALSTTKVFIMLYVFT